MMRVMRVLLDVSAVPDLPVGAGVYTVALARGLAADDRVDLVLLSRRSDAERWFGIAPGAAVEPRVPASRPGRLAWEQLNGGALAKRLGIEVWHGPHYTMPLRLRVPTVVTMHDPTFFDHPEWHRRAHAAFFPRMIRSSSQGADVCICVSHFTARRLIELVAPKGEVVVIHHGVDHDRFRPDHDEHADLALLHAHGIVPPYVAFAGTVEPRKDLPTLVAAFARSSTARPDLRLVLAGGDGWGTDALRDAIAGSGVATRVLRAGYLSDEALPAFFRRAELVAYPSLQEGFGLPALEALACGAPLVTTSGSAMDELVGDAALVVPPHDVDALAAAVEAALDPAVASRLHAAGPVQAAPFTWKASVDAHIAAYERVTTRAVAR
jgi:glycosyltransferase involved in cell wall biosynthesis